MASEVQNTIFQWVEESRKKGFSDEKIRKEMLEKGYMPHMVDKVLLGSSKNKNTQKYILFSLGAILIILIIVLGIIFVPSLFSKKCSTDECFILAANNCSSVKMEKIIAESVYLFSEKNCTLTKTLSRINESEPNL